MSFHVSLGKLKFVTQAFGFRNMYSQRYVDVIYAIFLVIAICKDVQPINITSVNIPKLARVGTRDPVILDCDYDMGKSKNTELVIKWYVNQDELLYQWIHGSKPKGSDEFRKYIDETYKASNDPNEMYRAVKLVRLGHELSGNVRCVISTQYDEVQASGEMLIYSPEKEIRLFNPKLNEESNLLTVKCLAKDLYPLPSIILRRNKHLIEDQRQYYKNNTDGRYSVEAVAVVPMDEVQLPEIFQCEVTLPEANYTSTVEYLYNGGAPMVDLPRSSIILGIFIATAATASSLVTSSQII